MNVGTLKSGLGIKRQAPTNSESVLPEATNSDKFRKRTSGDDKLRQNPIYQCTKTPKSDSVPIESRTNKQKPLFRSPSRGFLNVPNYRSVPQKYIGGVNYRHRKRYIPRDTLPVVFMRQPPAEPAACTQMNGLSRAESFFDDFKSKNRRRNADTVIITPR